MIELINHFVFNNCAQIFQIHNKTRFRIWRAFYGYIKREIMPVPIPVRTAPENLFILLITPAFHAQTVRRVEVFFPGYIADGQLYLNLLQK